MWDLDEAKNAPPGQRSERSGRTFEDANKAGAPGYAAESNVGFSLGRFGATREVNRSAKE